MIRFLVSILLILSFVGLHGQATRPVPSRIIRKIEEARELHVQMKWEESKKVLETLSKTDPDVASVWFTLGSMAIEWGKPTLAESSFRQFLRIDTSGTIAVQRWMTDRMFQTGRYQEALVFWDSYYSKIAGAALSQADSLLIHSLQYSLQQIARKDVPVVQKLPGNINTPFDEYFPSVTADGSSLVFTRKWIDSSSSGSRNAQEDLFEADLVENNSNAVQRFPYPITSDGNEGTQSLRQDGRLMIFTACNRPDSKGGCDLYLSSKTGGNWTSPVNIGYPVNTRYWESTPCISPDSRYMIFSSNRPGGKGGMDLWKSYRLSSGGWSEPVNMGSVVNTSGDEMSPAFGPQPDLFFFASTGHIGLGGFDLYQCAVGSDGSLSTPVNLGFPVNTYANEDGLALSGQRKTAYFASDRDSITGRDLYEVPWEFEETTEILAVSGYVTDSETGKPVVAWVEVHDPDEVLLNRVDTDGANGSFLLQMPGRRPFRIACLADGYLPYSSLVNPESSQKEMKIDIRMKPLRKGNRAVLENIYFSFGSAELLPQSNADLESLLNFLNSNPAVRIEISGHTDSIGSESFNLNLSKARAVSVKEWLTEKGISPGRLETAGFGAGQPIAENETESGRQKNRRTEVKVL